MLDHNVKPIIHYRQIFEGIKRVYILLPSLYEVPKIFLTQSFNYVLTFLVTPSAKKGMILGMFLMFLNQFSGSFAIMTYTADIFRNSGSKLTPNESSMIVAVVQLIGVYVSTICVDKFGRKVCTSQCINSISKIHFFI